MSITMHTLDAGQWLEYFESIGSALDGSLVTIEVMDEQIGDQVEAERLGQFFGVSLRASSKAKAHWNLEQMPGGMFALGVGGQLTGRGADVLVIDDPFKNSEEADSEVLREKLWDWFWSTARTRLEPKGAIVILMARWHEDRRTPGLNQGPQRGIRSSGKLIETV
jgi:hypothetical protein